MNPDRLRRHYWTLTPRERFSALTRAQSRGDKSEVRALLESSPKHQRRLPDTIGLSIGFDVLSARYILQQLTNGVLLSSAWNCALQGDSCAGHPADEEIRLAQRCILETHKAWQATCADFGVEPDAMLARFPWAKLVGIIEETAEELDRIDPVELTDLHEITAAWGSLIEMYRREI
jgi:hypothetical protein